jgi:hypothetical protein
MSDPVSSHEIQPTTCARRRKIFGIGWAKTGTTTLGRCFEILGYNHQRQNLSLVSQIMRGDFSKTLRIATAKESFGRGVSPAYCRIFHRAGSGDMKA